MNTKDFLVEIGTEELPPKAMPILADALTQAISEGLLQSGLITEHASKNVVRLAAPRRLAVLIPNVAIQQPEQTIEKWGPALNAPSAAIEGFAKSCGVAVDALQKRHDNKNERYYYGTKQPGVAAANLLPGIVIEAIKKLPIPKPMRWGSSDTEFIRPVHWVLMLLGDAVVEAEILGQKTDRVTYGHRFHHPDKISIKHAADYVKALKETGQVVVDFAERRMQIETSIKSLANEVNGTAYISDALLDEVTAIVEWPTALLAQFDPSFLKVPQEALMSAMQQHQKSFPLFDAHHKLLPNFIFVANIASRNPTQVIEGNQKVMRARLSDAMFFYNTDIATPLENHLEGLKNVLFQKELGTVYQRSQRMSTLAGELAKVVNSADEKNATRAGLLAKCDLLSNMVGEFPELQGIMGCYYAEASGEAKAVAQAIREQYQPAFADDQLPASSVGVCVALAEKTDTLVGIFGINQKPTGTKDPFALRRAAIGVLRLIIEKQLDIDLLSVLKQAAAQYQNLPNQNVVTDVHQYIVERLQYWLGDKGYSVGLFNAVKAVQQNNLYDFYRRVIAVDGFAKLPEAKQLAEANKRVKNILEAAGINDDLSNAVKAAQQNNLYEFFRIINNKTDFAQLPEAKQSAIAHEGVENILESVGIINHDAKIDADLFQQPAEQYLYQQLTTVQAILPPLVAQKDYAAILKNLAELKTPVEQFFADVMVMVEDTKLRDNRLLLLQQLRNVFLMVADVSALS